MAQRPMTMGLLMGGSILTAAIASIGGTQLLPLRLAAAASSMALSSALLYQVEQQRRHAYLDDIDAQIAIRNRQIYADARLQGEQLKAQFQAAEEFYAENPWMADYVVDVAAETVNPTGNGSEPSGPPPEASQGVSTAPASVLSTTQEIPFFDWHDLRDADRHPILGVVAKMGGGKSVLVKYLGKHILNASITVFDIYGSEADWAGCEVLYDYAQMVTRMAEDNKFITQDIAQYRLGKRDFPARLIVLEEGKATLKRLQSQGRKVAKTVEEWKLNYESVTRKIRRRLCQVSTNMNSEVFGSNAETRDEMTLIFPGREGIGKAMKDTSMLKLGVQQNKGLRDRLTHALEGVKRPALVYSNGEWFPASVPELDNNGDPIELVATTSSPPPQTVDRQFLESLLSTDIEEPSFDDNDAYEPSSDELKTALINAINLLITKGQKEDAKAVGQWLEADREQALWAALQALNLSPTATIRDVFEFGAGGRKFGEGKRWLESLKAKYGE
ncbi:hypothetical protein [Alkalinema sp. FACHB-956]|uniref:hypothetical protein n=1 Tax=Alkalinema sp. FACHB-956 TaxID=2692768 RepID=UPI0016855009|nr:hypothetical protein [Alkalinema sp. FACHB-956]MBD2329657.1 hypothetical protein [Alkalinema sp. FACHB-956]